MVGGQAILMLVGSFWCAFLGAYIASRYALILILPGGLAGFAIGAFAGAAFSGTLDVFADRALAAHKSRRHFRFVLWMLACVAWFVTAFLLPLSGVFVLRHMHN